VSVARGRPVAMTTDAIVSEAEDLVRSLAAELTTPRVGECLLCFVRRQLDEFGCDCTLRFARRYRDAVAPRATALEHRLGQKGGFCDCEIFLNGYTLADKWWTPEREIQRDGFVELVKREPPETLPPCAQVRRASTRPCALWVRLRRW
jgi:hypothetical protein